MTRPVFQFVRPNSKSMAELKDRSVDDESLRK
jgi:hypothetical protein